MSEVNLGIEHILAGAIHAMGGALEVPVDSIVSDEIVGKQFHLDVDNGVATVTLVDEETE